MSRLSDHGNQANAEGLGLPAEKQPSERPGRVPALRWWQEQQLFQPPPPEKVPTRPKAAKQPVWSEDKASLVENYIHLFLQLTKHGTYVDGFAGPQQVSKPETWAAKRLIEHEPQWLRHFHLFDIDPVQYALLDQLRRLHPERDTHVYRGDFNERVTEILRPEVIGPREATFALIDQRTFECRWSTLQALAAYPIKEYKIELFYFLANGWFDRAVAAVRDTGAVRAWWGRDDWEGLRHMKGIDRAMLMADRFKRELGYAFAFPFAIHERTGRGRVMYYMIHASDHPDAPNLMSRAYDDTQAQIGDLGTEQLRLARQLLR